MKQYRTKRKYKKNRRSRKKNKQFGGEIELVRIESFIKKSIELSNYVSMTPLVIYRSWHINMVPVKIKETVDNSIKLTPEFDNYFYSDDDNLQFIKENFEPNVANAYKCLKPGAYKADLWRYCILYKNGGVYTDIKMEIHIPLIDIIKEYPTLFINGNAEGRPGNPINQLWNGFMISPPNNPVFKECIDEIVINCKNKDYKENYLDITGPCLLWRIVNKHNSLSFISSIPITCAQAEYKFYYKDKLFLSQYKEYRNDQKKTQKTNHYGILYTNKDVFDTSIIFE